MLLTVIAYAVFFIKLLAMRTKARKQKESPVVNNHFRNCLNVSKLNEDAYPRGMTEQENHRKHHQSHHIQGNHHQSRQLSEDPSPKHPICPNFHPGHHQPTTEWNHASHKGNVGVQSRYCVGHNTELTDSNLKSNIQIVLNNLKSNYNAIKSHKLHEKLHNTNNNNCGYRQYNIREYWKNSTIDNTMTENQQKAFISPYSNETSMDSCDYQWFLESFREGVTHPSVLSSLSTSYNEFSYYDDFAKNIDANLAEVDMDNFHPGKINHMLTIQQLCNKTQFPRHDAELDNSICKSEQLFSPVKESHISIDSLDMDGFPDEDIILTCQANKNNYTIAFEGSTMYSDESFYDDDIKLDSKKRDDVPKKMPQESSMSYSDTGLTTWSKLKEHNCTQLIRYPSGNNNNSVNLIRFLPLCQVHKSSSLPNLLLKKQTQLHQITEQRPFNVLNVSQAMSNSTGGSYGKTHNLLPMGPTPTSTMESENQSVVHNNNSSPAGADEPKRSLNLVKLFIKQKSSSTDTCMDVSSGCWPSESSSSGGQKQRKRSMNDSGKCSALSKHDKENDFQYDSLDISSNLVEKPEPESNEYYRDVFDSPSNRNYNEYSLNIRNQMPKGLFNINNNNSIDKDSIKETNKSSSDATSENVTQIYFKQSTKIPVNMITRSMQTSVRLKDKVNVVTPSFLDTLHRLGEKQRAPVYVIYPNYALPDLDFVETHQTDIVLSPLGYKEERRVTKKRPATFHDTNLLNVRSEYNHVVDWKSLVPLLPQEYCKLLKHIPEVANADICINSQKPFFCMSPPLRRNRPASCDCASYVNSSSESSHPPSSGYRGSSTLLTDSDLADESDARYHNKSTEPFDSASVLPPSGRNAPKSILRHGKRSKRYSMFEQCTERVPSFAKDAGEKRRSLQDLPYLLISDMNNARNAEALTFKNTRLSENKTLNEDPKDCAEHYLNKVPRSEQKNHAIITNVLEEVDFAEESYDRNKLRSEVSKALFQKRVSFDKAQEAAVANAAAANTLWPIGTNTFKTPPNSPNISIALARDEQKQGELEKLKQEKIQRNRFKRLQIQFELMSNGECKLDKDVITETQSGGSTPTTATNTLRSRIPRPVSYPALPRPKTAEGRCIADHPKAGPSPVKTPVKKAGPTLTARSRTPIKLYNTPTKTVPSPRLTTRTR